MVPPGINDAGVIPRVLAHYARCAPLLEAGFAGSPIVFADFPRGLHGAARFRITHIPFSSARLGWLVQREYAIEFHTWAPLPGHPERLRFGRILIEPSSNAGFARVKEAALAVREHLLTAELDAIPLVDGIGGIALWLPFSEAPPATRMRSKLQRLALRAAATHPRVRIDAATNAPGRYSPLPYSLRGMPNLPVCSPVEWAELEGLRSAIVCSAESFPARIAARAHLFAKARGALPQQRLYPHARTRARKSLGG
jgi:DNA primase